MLYAVATAEHKPDRIGSGAGLAGAIEAESGAELGAVDAEIRARGYWEQVWRRFRKDRVAIASIVFIVFLVLAVYPGAWIAEQLLGHSPNDQFTDGITQGEVTFTGPDGEVITAQAGGIPVGPWSTVHHQITGEEQLLILGASDTLGRDEFLRLLYGGRVSLQVALLSTLFAVSLGVLLGAIAGYYRGWVDTVVSRLTEITMAFPVLLFAIALASTVGTRLDNVTFGFLGRGVVTLVLVFTIFGWFYPARIMRSKVLSLREKEFIEAALMTGASNWRVIRSHLLPHLVAPIIVYSTLIVASYILGEAALSFLGVGIKLPTPSWGNLLSTAPEFYTTQPWLMLWPGLAVILTTLAFNLLGDGLRDAFDPRSRV
jgi:peptide/nickel transport system permease protein